VAIVGVLAYLGTLALGWERSIELLNFGALLAFTAVNLAAVRYFGFSRERADKRNILVDIIIPSLGFIFCLVIFLGLQGSTILMGGVWIGLGAVYVVLKTKGMGAAPVMIDFNESRSGGATQ
jgi:putrescine importer